MKRILITGLVSVALSSFVVQANGQSETCVAQQEAKKTTVECPLKKTLTNKGIMACPPTGCGSVDKLLNQQKNTFKGDPDTKVDMKFADIAAIPKCVDGYKGIGDVRKPLQDAGEGKMVRVVAWALDARPQKSRKDKKTGKVKKGESCNCGFTGVNDPQNTDVHIVLVDDEILKLKPKKREAQSLTAEYAPRVRADRNEEFDGAKLKSLINPTKGGRLLVRITGLLMYDSEHAYQNPLTRQSNWEIHPVFRLEFCPKGKDCQEDSDEGWIDINK